MQFQTKDLIISDKFDFFNTFNKVANYNFNKLKMLKKVVRLKDFCILVLKAKGKKHVYTLKNNLKQGKLLYNRIYTYYYNFVIGNMM
jgi:predicted membrane GTPase involved in stress response